MSCLPAFFSYTEAVSLFLFQSSVNCYDTRYVSYDMYMLGVAWVATGVDCPDAGLRDCRRGRPFLPSATDHETYSSIIYE